MLLWDSATYVCGLWDHELENTGCERRMRTLPLLLGVSDDMKAGPNTSTSLGRRRWDKHSSWRWPLVRWEEHQPYVRTPSAPPDGKTGGLVGTVFNSLVNNYWPRNPSGDTINVNDNQIFRFPPQRVPPPLQYGPWLLGGRNWQGIRLVWSG